MKKGALILLGLGMLGVAAYMVWTWLKKPKEETEIVSPISRALQPSEELRDIKAGITKQEEYPLDAAEEAKEQITELKEYVETGFTPLSQAIEDLYGQLSKPITIREVPYEEVLEEYSEVTYEGAGVVQMAPAGGGGGTLAMKTTLRY